MGNASCQAQISDNATMEAEASPSARRQRFLLTAPATAAGPWHRIAGVRYPIRRWPHGLGVKGLL